MISRSPQRVLSLSLGDVDLRLLRVFVAIVRHNGFSAAQASLGMTQATISIHMRELEERLGLRLCERGRRGFILTEEGSQVHAAALELFNSIERFQSRLSDAQGELSGTLRFGLVDAMVTNSALNLPDALAAFHRAAPRVRLEIDVAAPQVLHQGLLNGSYQVVLTPETAGTKSHFKTRDVFFETQKLYCGQKHDLFNLPDESITPALLEIQPFAGRTYMPDTPICGVNFSWSAATPHMEGTLLLLLAGTYIGFLPDHYANESVQKGLLRAILPNVMSFEDIFHIAYPRERPSRAAQTLTDAILETLGAR